MAYNANALVRLAALKALAEKTKAEIDNINTDVSKAIIAQSLILWYGILIC